MIHGIIFVGVVIALCILVERERVRKRDERIERLREKTYRAWH